eukprot:jgi/Psemu1/60943/gm1.60943_g
MQETSKWEPYLGAYTSSNNSYLGNFNLSGQSGGRFGGRGNGAGRGPNQNDYGRRAGGQGNGAGAGREPVSNNESNYNQWWGQDNRNYHGDAYSNITASEATQMAAEKIPDEPEQLLRENQMSHGGVCEYQPSQERLLRANRIPDKPGCRLLRNTQSKIRGNATTRYKKTTYNTTVLYDEKKLTRTGEDQQDIRNRNTKKKRRQIGIEEIVPQNQPHYETTSEMNTQFQPCIQYERTFDITEDHDSHKLVVDYAKPTNRLTVKKNIRRVQDLDVEEILHTYDIFVDACDDLGMPVDRWHTQWGQCLSRGPRKRWNEIVANGEIDHSREGFKTTVQAYINAIIPDPDAKGTMIEAFEHHHMAKPKEVSERAHFNRIDMILNYIDMLPRDNNHNLTEQQRKRMFFKTHPKSWQDSYMDTAVNFREVTILQIRDYMTRRKDRADKTERGKNNRTPSIREQEGGKQKDIQRGNDEREIIGRDDCSFAQCKRHPNGNHTWEQRYFNPKNRQHSPYPQYTMDDLADELEVEVMEPEEDPTKTTMAGKLAVKAMEPVQEKNLYPTMKATITNGGDRTIVIIMETPIPTLRQARPVFMRSKDRARIYININTR